MYQIFKKGRHQYFLGLMKRFQGIGIIIRLDNPIIEK